MNPQRSEHDEVDQLLLNARLRDELEPFLDESVDIVNTRKLPTPEENEFLASMLAWERAPVLPIADWFKPRLVLARPQSLTARELHRALWDIIHRLFDKRIVLDFTDHLSDFALYCLIARDILPSPEKKIEDTPTYLHWHCLDPTDEPDVWLQYYASNEERQSWVEETGNRLPAKKELAYKRTMPTPGL